MRPITRSAAVGASVLLCGNVVGAFAPTPFVGRVNTAQSLHVDPSSFAFHDLSHHSIDTLGQAFSSLTLADGETPLLDAASATAAASSVDPSDVAEAVSDAATDNGWFGFLAGPIEGSIQLFHSILVAVGLSANSWGISILFMTVVIKILTFPLTKTQMESTQKMQALQPTIKELQAKYQSNPEVMNQKVAEVYQTNDVNPLAGCLPSFAQIPIFIGLYRAVLNLAKEDKLNEPFLFLPNLEGPTYGADPAHGSDWIMQNWVDGVPSLGWEDTTAFLILPVFLVVSQFVSMQIMQPPPGPDGKTPDQPIILKFLPLMIGWFSLNVPAALCIYWVANNIITTATTVLIRNNMKMEPISTGGGGAAAVAPTQSVFAPSTLREKPSGFAASAFEEQGMQPITATSEVIDAEFDDEDMEEDVLPDSGEGMGTATESKKRGKKKKKKKKT